MARTFFGRKAPAKLERVYAAGLFDGEGSITVLRAGELAARIQMCDSGPIRRLNAAFGGRVYLRIQDRRPTRTPINQIAYQGYEALWFLRLIVPHMRNARQVAKATWLLTHWDDYATSRHHPNGKPRRKQICLDFHAQGWERLKK